MGDAASHVSSPGKAPPDWLLSNRANHPGKVRWVIKARDTVEIGDAYSLVIEQFPGRVEPHIVDNTFALSMRLQMVF